MRVGIDLGLGLSLVRRGGSGGGGTSLLLERAIVGVVMDLVVVVQR